MVICGIDPGTARVGWAMIQVEGSTITPLAYGCITTEPSSAMESRLENIHKQTTKLFIQYAPSYLSIEELFFTVNAKTVIPVAQARGVLLLAAAQRQIPVVSYTPSAVKLAICGDGTADKKQVQWMIKTVLKLKEVPKPDDVADALAIALSHCYSYRFQEQTQ